VPAMAEAQQDFEQALSLDPSFARAAEGVLLSYLNRIYAGAVPNNSGWPRLQQLAATALQLDPHSAFAHSALTWFHYSYDYDWSACNREIDTVIAARTHDPTALIYAAYVAGAIGRSADGTNLIREALTLDPLNPDVYQALGGILLYQRDYEGAERAFRRSLDISPQFAGSHLYIGGTRLFSGHPKEALSEIEAEPASVGRDALLTATFFALGKKRDSDASLQRLLANKDGDTFWIAAAYGLRNQSDLAFEWLNKAYERKDLSLSLGRSEYFANLRTDPRWKPFMRRMNIPE
jgi:adenylate cyclase